MKKKSVFKIAANLYNTQLVIAFNDYNSVIGKNKRQDG